MKFSAILFASTASLALAAPIDTIQERGDYCEKNGVVKVTGAYTIYNNLWGQAKASSGSQCTGVDGLDGNSLKWHTKWTWDGAYVSPCTTLSLSTASCNTQLTCINRSTQVKSYANAVTKVEHKALSSIKSLDSKWSWSYSGSSLKANVAYDLFTASSASGTSEYEIMIWLTALGKAFPISSSNDPVATVTLAGSSWKLYKGKYENRPVFSFVATNEVRDFSGDIMDFMNYLTSKQGMPKSQILQTVGAGTEPFTGSSGKLTTSDYQLTQS